MKKQNSPDIKGLLKAGAQLLGPLPFPPPVPLGTQQLTTVDRQRLVDIYAPEKNEGPLHGMGVLIVHGGGFIVGSRRMKPVLVLIRSLLDAGAWVASTDYTLVPQRGTLEQETMEVRDTLGWWRKKLNNDLNHKAFIGAVGLSAGVCPLIHSACLYPETRPDSITSLYGALRFHSDASRVVSLVYKQLLQTSDPALWVQQSASTVMQREPYPLPMQFIHGKADTVCRYDASEDAHQWRQEQGLPSALHLHPGAPHGFLNQTEASEAMVALQQIQDFLAGNLRNFSPEVVSSKTGGYGCSMTRSLLITRFLALALLGLVGCSSVMQPIDLRTDVVETSGLRGFAETFYKAQTTEEMEQAVKEALSLNPQAGLSNEIAAVFAQLNDMPSEQFLHLVIALRDARNQSAAIHLRMLSRLQLGTRERAILFPLLERLAENHPEGSIRSYAARMLGEQLYKTGEYSSGLDWLEQAGLHPSFALVGPWDNDQGKALDTLLPPERGFEIDESYRGVVTQSSWQTDHVETQTLDVDLLERIRPDEWVAAYLASTIIAAENTRLVMNIGTTDPIKVWVNGSLLLEAREGDRHRTDQFVVPVDLEKGENEILVKTAHQEGAWKFSARLTGQDGLFPQGVSSTLPTQGKPCNETQAVWTPKRLVQDRTNDLEESPARRAYHMNVWFKEMGAKRERVHHLESALSQYTNSIALDYEYAMSLWNIFESGRTSNQLEKLHRVSRGNLPILFAKRGRFFRQKKRFDKARDILLEGQKAYPKAETILLEIERLYSEERWYQDASRVMEQLQEMHPGVISYLKRLRALLDTEGKLTEARDIEEQLLNLNEGDWSTLAGAFLRHLGKNELGAADDIADLMKEHHHARASTWRYVAQLERRRGDSAAALDALQKGIERSPYDSAFPKEIGRILYDSEKKDQAISAWEQALELDPDDERLAHRLQFLQEGEKEAWQEDVPTLDSLFSRLTGTATPTPGANLHIHLDHEVTRLYADGTTANVRTFVAEALNEAGRDRLTRNKLSGSGRKRVLHAVAVTSDGTRLEASAIRGNTVRFRGLDVGSKIILQYREDAAPRGYLSKYMVRQWWFQAGPAAVLESEWVLWLPKDTTLHIDKVGSDILETRRTEDDLVRYTWLQRDIPPVIPETLMPSVMELGNLLRVSTVPGWEFFVEWEKALLENAFRSSPQVTALAKELTAGESDKVKAVHKLHQYVMQKIRYQQDYETMIAGVKPHAAPTVLERKYGDCKDKTVLFTELARTLGVQVHFALIRTRPRGPVAVDIPSQQFNHVVPYIPAQEGIEQGFFLDPTADALDITSMRHDDVGTLSLVYDPIDSSFEWREVPYQTPAQTTFK